MEVVMAFPQTLWCCGVLRLTLPQNLVGVNIVEALESLYVVLVMEVARVGAVPIPILLAVTILMVVVAGVTRIQREAAVLPQAAVVKVAAAQKTTVENKLQGVIRIQYHQQGLVPLRVLPMLLVAGHREELL